MATTAIFPLHIGTGRSVAKALKGVIDYLEDVSRQQSWQKAVVVVKCE